MVWMPNASQGSKQKQIWTRPTRRTLRKHKEQPLLNLVGIFFLQGIASVTWTRTLRHVIHYEFQIKNKTCRDGYIWKPKDISHKGRSDDQISAMAMLGTKITQHDCFTTRIELVETASSAGNPRIKRNAKRLALLSNTTEIRRRIDFYESCPMPFPNEPIVDRKTFGDQMRTETPYRSPKSLDLDVVIYLCFFCLLFNTTRSKFNKSAMFKKTLK